MSKDRTILFISVLVTISIHIISLIIAGNAMAHPPSEIHLDYNKDTENLTVYINHKSSDPDTHYIENVTVIVNGREYLNETYTSQKLDDEKDLVKYTYSLEASEGDEISVTVECSIHGTLTEHLQVDGDEEEDGFLFCGSFCAVGLTIIFMILFAVFFGYKLNKRRDEEARKQKEIENAEAWRRYYGQFKQ